MTWWEIKTHPAALVRVKVTEKREQNSENGKVWEKEGYKQEKYGIYVEKEQKKIDYDAVRETQQVAVVLCVAHTYKHGKL